MLRPTDQETIAIKKIFRYSEFPRGEGMPHQGSSRVSRGWGREVERRLGTIGKALGLKGYP